MDEKYFKYFNAKEFVTLYFGEERVVAFFMENWTF